jgi:hypothetical protein
MVIAFVVVFCASDNNKRNTFFFFLSKGDPALGIFGSDEQSDLCTPGTPRNGYIFHHALAGEEYAFF